MRNFFMKRSLRKIQLKFGPRSEFFSKGIQWDDAAKLLRKKGYDFVMHFSSPLTAMRVDLTLIMNLMIFLKLSKWQLIVHQLSRQENVIKDVFPDPSLPFFHLFPSMEMSLQPSGTHCSCASLAQTSLSHLILGKDYVPVIDSSVNAKQIVTSPTTLWILIIVYFVPRPTLSALDQVSHWTSQYHMR